MATGSTEGRGGTSVEEFPGVIGRTLSDSQPWWPARPHPGEEAPNVLVVLLDDLGFAHLGCFGSTIDTPCIDRLAAGGLRFTNFHVTPLCSPTRAALITGRNHHEVGMRSLSNFDTGFPNMRGHVSNHAGTVAEVLRDEGYTTFALGKWHLCRMEDASAAGPFDQWPLQRGFDRFYGFLDGETDQFHPELVCDNHAVDQPTSAAEGYHLSEDLVDHAIRFVHDTKSIRPDRPFFMYLAFGATHAPHQAPQAYLDKYRGRFDNGWDATRDEWFERQREMGLFPGDTALAPRNPGVEAWDDLPESHRLLAARLQEAFAAFLDHTDSQIGRLVDALESLGELDNTLIFLLSDNGASQEGGPHGVLNEWKYFNFFPEHPDEAVRRVDDIGGPRSHTNYPWGWAQAGNSPFKWYKQNTHEGGVHVPLVVHWPSRVADAGLLRGQFHHVNDVVPTIYEALGVVPPHSYRGYEQMPVTGVSMLYTLDDPGAESRKAVQYFEMMGHRAIVAGGWKAVTRHQSGTPFDDDTWELYHLERDRSECHDLAAEMPEKVAELVDLWWLEAEEHGVLPLDDRTIELFGARFRERSPHTPDRTYVYRPPMSPMPAQAGAAIGGRSWDLDARIVREGGTGGVVFATGSENSGLSVFVHGDRLVFDYNCFGEHHVVESGREVPAGSSEVGVRFRRREAGGEITLVVDGTECATMEIPFVMRIISSVGSSVGYDHGSQVSDRYEGEFPFEGRLESVRIRLVSPGRRDDQAGAEADARTSMSRQ